MENSTIYIIFIIFILICVEEIYLALKANIVIAAVIPIIVFILTFRYFISLLKGISAMALFPSLASLIIILIFISCRLVVIYERFNKMKNDINKMKIKDI